MNIYIKFRVISFFDKITFMDDGFDIIFSYTRKQAIEDGNLIDVSELAKECGFKYPVAVTIALWNEYIVPTKKMKSLGQSEEGRMWDVLNILRVEGRKSDNSIVEFDTVFMMEDEKKGYIHKTVKIKAICGPGDNAEPVITIMFPYED